MMWFFVGLFLGSLLGVLAMSMFFVSARADDQAEEMRRIHGIKDS